MSSIVIGPPITDSTAAFMRRLPREDTPLEHASGHERSNCVLRHAQDLFAHLRRVLADQGCGSDARRRPATGNPNAADADNQMIQMTKCPRCCNCVLNHPGWCAPHRPGLCLLQAHKGISLHSCVHSPRRASSSSMRLAPEQGGEAPVLRPGRCPWPDITPASVHLSYRQWCTSSPHPDRAHHAVLPRHGVASRCGSWPFNIYCNIGGALNTAGPRAGPCPGADRVRCGGGNRGPR